MMKPKYISDALIWDFQLNSWLRIKDLNLIKWHGKEYYTPASRGGRAVYLIAILYPYEDWMEEYIGTDKDIRKDERLKNETDKTEL